MKNVSFLLLFVICSAGTASGQFRGEEPRRPSVSEGMYESGQGNMLFGIFNPDNFDMQHSLSFSYGMFGEQGMGVSMYTNSLRYRISEPLSVRADISMMFAPFGSASSMFKNDISGIFLRRASVDYQAGENMRISLQYRNDPYYNPYYGSYGRYGSMGSGLFFNDTDSDW
jgi:hypothetical protein